MGLSKSKNKKYEVASFQAKIDKQNQFGSIKSTQKMQMSETDSMKTNMDILKEHESRSRKEKLTHNGNRTEEEEKELVELVTHRLTRNSAAPPGTDGSTDKTEDRASDNAAEHSLIACELPKQSKVAVDETSTSSKTEDSIEVSHLAHPTESNLNKTENYNNFCSFPKQPEVYTPSNNEDSIQIPHSPDNSESTSYIANGAIPGNDVDVCSLPKQSDESSISSKKDFRHEDEQTEYSLPIQPEVNVNEDTLEILHQAKKPEETLSEHTTPKTNQEDDETEVKSIKEMLVEEYNTNLQEMEKGRSDFVHDMLEKESSIESPPKSEELVDKMNTIINELETIADMQKKIMKEEQEEASYISSASICLESSKDNRRVKETTESDEESDTIIHPKSVKEEDLESINLNSPATDKRSINEDSKSGASNQLLSKTEEDPQATVVELRRTSSIQNEDDGTMEEKEEIITLEFKKCKPRTSIIIDDDGKIQTVQEENAPLKSDEVKACPLKPNSSWTINGVAISPINNKLEDIHPMNRGNEIFEINQICLKKTEANDLKTKIGSNSDYNGLENEPVNKDNSTELPVAPVTEESCQNKSIDRKEIEVKEGMEKLEEKSSEKPKSPGTPWDLRQEYFSYLNIIQEIKSDAEKLKSDIEDFVGRKDDVQYVYLNETLLRCLLKLGSIISGDEEVKKRRKEGVEFVQECMENLDNRAIDGSNEQLEIAF